jgi:hypothetical protein
MMAVEAKRPAGRGLVRALALWLPMAAAGAAPAAPCALVDLARVRALAPEVTGALATDAPGTLLPRDLPGLPVPLRIDQCTSAAGAGGAIGFRLGLITAPRELSNAEWAAVGRALDHAEPMHAAAPQCAVESEPRRQGGTLHTAMCGQTRGRYRLEISFEHIHAARLPPLEAVRGLLAAAMARL